jgi:predicted AlkP superfamily phosphohydrolase/phosphomutase
MTSPAKARPFRKVFCVGLDGATFDVIDPLIAKGKLPALEKLLASGTRARLASTVPPLSAPAWVSFMTGTNPGRHGVFHFRAMDEGTLGSSLVGSWAYRGRTIFDYASRAGLDVLAFRVPMTYPPWPLQGVMVAGFPTPDPRTNYSSPAEVAERIGPLVKLSPFKAMMANLDAQIENIDYYLERSTKALVELAAERDADLFCYVNSATDWIAHKFWRYSDPRAPGYEPRATDNGTLLESFYEKVDASLGALLDEAADDALVIVLSDHGTGPRTVNRFNTNAWLEELGLWERSPRNMSGSALKTEVIQWVKKNVPGKTSLKPWLWQKFPPLRSALRSSAQGLRDYGGAMNSARSRTYRMSLHDHVEGVNVNLVGREPDGIVEAGDFESTRELVIEAARSMTDPATGRRLFHAVHKREELYEGAHAHLAPDVVLILDPEEHEFGTGSGKKGVFSRVPASHLGHSSATHRPDGILAMAGPGVRTGELEGIQLIDVPATIMWALGLEVPDEMDGRVLTEAFWSELAESFPVRHGAAATQESESSAFTAEEEEQMTAHLRDLGYL